MSLWRPMAGVAQEGQVRAGMGTGSPQQQRAAQGQSGGVGKKGDPCSPLMAGTLAVSAQAAPWHRPRGSWCCRLQPCIYSAPDGSGAAPGTW